MEYQTAAVSSRMHPLMVGAAASVILVSLLGAAVITGILPSSHSTSVPSGQIAPAASVTTAPAISNLSTLSNLPNNTQAPTVVSPTRFVTADGRVFEEVKSGASARPSPLQRAVASTSTDRVQENRAPVRRSVRPQQRVAANSTVVDNEPSFRQVRTSAEPVQASVPAVAQSQSVMQTPTKPTSIFGDVNPVQTGVGAVIGGLLGSQIGKGNGRTLATVAGVIAGGYAGNEISHGRNPVPTW